MADILIIDDEENIRRSLGSALERRGHRILTAPDLKNGRRLARESYDLIFLDVRLPDGSGLDLLHEIKTSRTEQAVVMISGQSDIETAVTAIKEGAFDFIEKPLSLDRIFITIENVLKTNRLKNETKRLSSLLYGEFIGEAPIIKLLKEEVIRSAAMTTKFLITGENGSGKELVAHMIHRYSAHAEGPFVPVNCAALPHNLVEAELFGHDKGAFTGAVKARAGKFVEANEGTIFLDEIAEMPLEAQAKILRAIETRQINPVGSDQSITVDCHIIAATNKDLTKLVADKKFREDLFYRLNIVQFQIPPLRDRKEDIPLLAAYFLNRFADETGVKPKKLTADALRAMAAYDFPGNVRELKNLMERVNIYCRSEKIAESDLRPHISRPELPLRVNLKDAVSRFEIDLIKKIIDRNGGNISKAARQLGIERSHLYKKLKKEKEA